MSATGFEPQARKPLLRILLEAGAPASTTNEAGRTPLEELRADLEQLEAEGSPAETHVAMRRSRLMATLEAMEISLIAAA